MYFSTIYNYQKIIIDKMRKKIIPVIGKKHYTIVKLSQPRKSDGHFQFSSQADTYYVSNYSMIETTQ